METRFLADTLDKELKKRPETDIQSITTERLIELTALARIAEQLEEIERTLSGMS